MFNKIFGITNPDVISGLLLKIYTYYTCTCTYIYYQYMILSNILYIIHLSSRSRPYAWFKFYMAAMELANLPTPASDASSNLFCRPSHSDTNSTLGKRWAMLSGWLLVILVVFPILGGNKKNSGEDLTNPYNQSFVTQRICACESCVPYVPIPSMFQHILFSSGARLILDFFLFFFWNFFRFLGFPCVFVVFLVFSFHFARFFL